MRKRNTVRLFGLLMSAAFLLGILPLTAFAEGESTALSSAGPIAPGAYHLEADLNGDLTIPAGTNASIDLRGHDIRGTGTGTVITIENGGTLTLTDSSTDVIRYGRWAGETYTIDSTQQEGDDVLTGGCITGGNAVSKNGGGVLNQGSFVMQGGNIAGNTASSGGGGGGGGGVYNESGFTMQGGMIAGNIADSGGGVYSSHPKVDPVFTMSGTAEIRNNHARAAGGGICNYLGSVTLDGVNITGNTAGGSGGGIYSMDGNITLDGGSITGNTAGGSGGGVCSLAEYNHALVFAIRNGNISGNTAAQYGGGIYHRGSAPGRSLLSISGTSQIKDNLSGKGYKGGGIYNEYSRSDPSVACIELSDTPQITGNKSGTAVSNIRLDGPLIVKNKLGEGAVIGVTTSTNPDYHPTIAKGKEGYTLTAEDMAKFTSDEGYVVGNDGKLSHKATQLAGQAATCTAYGWNDYYRCSICGKLFEDSACTIEIPDLEAWKTGRGKIEKSSHTGMPVNGQAPTCTAYGWQGYYQCSVCGKLFEDKACTIEIPDLEAWKTGKGKIEKSSHTGMPVNGQAPTNSADGWQGYYQCSVCGKLFEDKACTIEIPDLEAWKTGKGKIEKLGYFVTGGDQSSWQKGSEKTLTFTSNGLFDNFTGLQVDGTEVPWEHYTAESGSTVVTLKKDYLQSLGDGAHTVTFLYSDGQCSAGFTVVAATVPAEPEVPETPAPAAPDLNTPQTGDESNMMLWLLFGLASVFAAAGMIRAKKKDNRI